MRRRQDEAPVEIRAHDAAIPEVAYPGKLHILGLQFNNKGANAEMIAKLRMTCEQVIRMITRITNKTRGMMENDTLRLVQAFTLSRIMYVDPYLRMRKCDLNNFDFMLRTAYKKALGLSVNTSTERLLQLGVHNTTDELIEAHLLSQYASMAGMKTGRKVLDT